MDAAKAAIKDFTSKAGHHDTTVHEHHKPAVTHEHATPATHHHEETAVDREVHQEHHHTRVQPIHHREVLPEKHHHQMKPVEHKELHHGDHQGVKERLAAEAAQFKDVQHTGKEEHTKHTAPVRTSEHVHHHVHETIQPVIQKQTIQPHVVHTTIPIHEVHHKEPIHHTATAAPAISMADFKKQGGSLTGQDSRTHHFDGEPHAETADQHARHAGAGEHRHGLGTAAAGGVAGATAAGVAGDQYSMHNRHDGRDTVDQDREHHGRGLGTATTSGTGLGTAGAVSPDTLRHDKNNNKIDSHVDPRIDSTRHNAALAPGTTTATDGIHHTNKLQKPTSPQYADTHAGSTRDSDINTPHHTAQIAATNASRNAAPGTDDTVISPKKPSLIDRLNPLKDSDGDGKKGVMH